MLSFRKKNKTKDDIQTVDNNEAIKTEEPKEEYIWVEGYKGTNEDMECVHTFFYGDISKWTTNSMKYELGKEFVLDDEPVTCANGYHFCLNLKDVFKYYPFDFSDRYFKVKAYVKKSEYETTKNNNDDSKIAAKKIILYEEIFPDYEMVKDCLSWEYDRWRYCIPEDVFNKYVEKNMDLVSILRDIFIEKMSGCGYSKSFSLVLFEENFSIKKISKLMNYVLSKAKTFREENISNDMAVYLLLKDV